MDRVRRFWADDVRQLDAFFTEGLFHHVCGLLLAINLAAVSDRRAVPEVEAPAGAVVPVPKLLFPPRRLQIFLLKDLKKVGRLTETRAGIGGEPAVGVMDGELPG